MTGISTNMGLFRPKKSIEKIVKYIFSLSYKSLIWACWPNVGALPPCSHNSTTMPCPRSCCDTKLSFPQTLKKQQEEVEADRVYRS